MRVSTVGIAARIITAFIIIIVIMTVSYAWAARNQPTNTEVVEKTPKGCEKFARNADAFVAVTSEFLATQNDAVDAVLDDDPEQLEIAVSSMNELSNKYSRVMDRYSNTRAGCL